MPATIMATVLRVITMATTPTAAAITLMSNMGPVTGDHGSSSGTMMATRAAAGA